MVASVRCPELEEILLFDWRRVGSVRLLSDGDVYNRAFVGGLCVYGEQRSLESIRLFKVAWCDFAGA